MNLNDVARLKGCFSRSRSLETSCGCCGVDSLLGGGVPISAFFCVDELKTRNYSECLARYFVAEGLYAGHDVLVVDPSNGDELWSGVPTKIEAQSAPSSSEPPKVNLHPEDLKIAFRYAAQPPVNSLIGEKNRYDLGKPLDLEAFSAQRLSYDNVPSYEFLYKFLVELCGSERYCRTQGQEKILLRIVINHLGCPLWQDPSCLSAFLIRVRALIRRTYAVLFATTASETMYKQLSQEVFVTSDIYIQLSSISEEDQKKLSGREKYHGYLRILRLPRIVSIGTNNPPADLVFTKKRNSFDVSVLHLPPASGSEGRSPRTLYGIEA